MRSSINHASSILRFRGGSDKFSAGSKARGKSQGKIVSQQNLKTGIADAFSPSYGQHHKITGKPFKSDFLDRIALGSESKELDLNQTNRGPSSIKVRMVDERHHELKYDSGYSEAHERAQSRYDGYPWENKF